MAAEGLSIENTLHFSDHSTKEIFDQLLDIGPVNALIHSKGDSNYKDLNETEFHHNGIQNSMMTDVENTEISVVKYHFLRIKKITKLFILFFPSIA